MFFLIALWIMVVCRCLRDGGLSLWAPRVMPVWFLFVFFFAVLFFLPVFSASMLVCVELLPRAR